MTPKRFFNEFLLNVLFVSFTSESNAKFFNLKVDRIITSCLQVCLFRRMLQIIFKTLLTNLTVSTIWCRYLEILLKFAVFALGMRFVNSFDFLFKLKFLESLILDVVLLCYEFVTLSTGRRKAGVKKSLSRLKVGMTDFKFVFKLCFLKYTFLFLGNLFGTHMLYTLPNLLILTILPHSARTIYMP